MSVEKFVLTDASALADLRRAKEEWSKKLLKAAGPSALVARAAASTPEPTHNVVGVGVGEKISGGELTGTMAVKFFVRAKYAESQIPKSAALPKTISGLPVDVEESGTFRALAMPNPKAKWRPAQPGCSIGYRAPGDAYIMAGTFGAVVKNKRGQTFILSNNHVLADENQMPLGAPIFQAGLLDGGNAATDAIATLTKFVPLSAAGNKVDAAIAKPNSASLIKRDILYIGPPSGKAVATLGMNVHKFGRTTSYTTGRINSIDTDVSVGYETGTYTFTSQIIIVSLTRSPFSKAGDSGSLILERATQKAVGLLFAGSASHTVANHIGDVLAALGVAIA